MGTGELFGKTWQITRKFSKYSDLEGHVEINPLEFFINTLQWKIIWNPAT